MSVIYTSTRGNGGSLKASEAIIKGLADDGGLFVPDKLPEFGFGLDELKDMDYKETAYAVMSLLLTDYTEEELRDCINRAYDAKFDTGLIAPLVKKGDKYFLELFHGKTIAFKDMALSILPYLLTTAIRKNRINKKVVILTATSGDTGKAALAGFSDVEGTEIIVFYPKGGVSRIQELQMVTEKGRNTRVFGVNGNFDDCQSGVKAIFNDEALKKELDEKGYVFSSANSINIGRLVPQIAYYVYAYGSMLKSGELEAGEKVNFVVPTGNFGNILAAFYAKKMGLPVGKLICASNSNNVLYDFFKTGEYDKNREFVLTASPSMDILISSNLERLIYHIAGNDPVKNRELMESLQRNGRYRITEEMKEGLSDFYGVYATEEQTFAEIRELFNRTGYMIDTHTAVASFAESVYRNESGDASKNIIISTASPYKFARSVYKAIKGEVSSEDDFVIADDLSDLSKTGIPDAVRQIRNADIIHNKVCECSEMREAVRGSLV
ncbi:MAG TPA: threonine synthase [Lachnospiraceae bacterium]|nr:threonine synthase [Lachnospiraceae bacterium]